jgi:hypothetical protein
LYLGDGWPGQCAPELCGDCCCSGNGDHPSCYDMARALGKALCVPPVHIKVSSYLPEGFIAEFPGAVPVRSSSHGRGDFLLVICCTGSSHGRQPRMWRPPNCSTR